MKTISIDADAQRQLKAQLDELVDEPETRRPSIHTSDLGEELNRAVQIKKKAQRLTAVALEDARMGRQVQVKPIHEIAVEMMESLLRNDDALLNLSLIKGREDYLLQHSVNVGIFLMAVSRSFGFDDDSVVAAGMGGMMHDIGMVQIPEEIYNKPKRLTDYEFRQVQKHVELGYRLLVRTPGVPEIALAIAGQHHFRFDGSGYTLKPNLAIDRFYQIQQLSSIVDVYEAMTSDRPYRKAWTATSALGEIYEMSSRRQLDLGMVHTFIHHIGVYPLGSLVRLENQLLGIVIKTNRANLLHPCVRVLLDTRDGKKIEPRDVDLSECKDKQEGYAIVGHEHHETWAIDPADYFQKDCF